MNISFIVSQIEHVIAALFLGWLIVASCRWIILSGATAILLRYVVANYGTL